MSGGSRACLLVGAHRNCRWSCSVNCLKGDYIGDSYRVIKGDPKEFRL